MKIKNSWFLDISWFDDEKIIIDDNIIVTFYDEWIFDRKIIIWNWSTLEYYSLFSFSGTKKTVLVEEEWLKSKFIANILLFSEKFKLDYSINSIILSDKSVAKIKILSLIWEEWDINLDWIINIKDSIDSAVWILEEENIFLSTKWKINAKPQLLVKSNNVEARHSCKVERLEQQKLFYINSRWFSQQEAKKIVLIWKIRIISNLNENIYIKL